MMIHKRTLVLLLGFCSLFPQDYHWPIESGKAFSSNFGEFRGDHFHMGLDLKTDRTGYPVYAVEDGYISRMVANFVGYGKALYITTEKGYTAVYAHLDRFSPFLEQILQKQQKKNQSYLVNTYFRPGNFTVKKGDVIGYSGDTGYSFAPHLHFEIRNAKEQPLNPLTHGFKVPDRLPPVPREIAIIPLSSDTWINGSALPQILPLLRDKKGRYSIPDTVNGFGSFGLALRVVDRIQSAPNKYQVYKITVSVDQQLVYSLTFDSLDYDESKSVRIVQDYRLKRLNLGAFTRLYRRDPLPKTTVNRDNLSGILSLSPGYHYLEINVEDAAGNRSLCTGNLFIQPPIEIALQPLSETANSFTYLLKPVRPKFPLKSVIIYSFTPFGYADAQVSILQQESISEGLRVTLPRKQVENRTLQFLGTNILGGRSKPLHWAGTLNSLTRTQPKVNLEIRQIEGNLFFQVEAKPFTSSTLLLKLQKGSHIIPLPMEQIQPNVYLSPALTPAKVAGTDQVITLFSDGMDWETRFKFKPQLALPNTLSTVFSNDRLCSAQILPTSVYDSTLMWIEAVDNPAPVEGGTLLSRVYQLQPFDVPLRDTLRVGLRYEEAYRDLEHLALYYYDVDDGWTYIPSRNSRSRRVLTGALSSLEAVAILQDTTPPVFTSFFPGAGGHYQFSDVRKLRVQVQDDLSGIDPRESALSLALDGVALLFAYQPVKKELSYNLIEPLSSGAHTMTATVRDKAGNLATRTIQFTID